MENRLPFRTAVPGQENPAAAMESAGFGGARTDEVKEQQGNVPPLQRAGAALDAVSADSAGRPGNRTSCFFAVCRLPAGLQFAKD